MLKKAFFAIVVVVLSAFAANAQVPQLINYQGLLTDTEGDPISGEYSVQFGIYNSETGGEALWSETQNVVVTDGLFQVLLGAVTLIPHSVFDGGDKYLSVKVGSDPEMTPRRRVVSVAYAYHSNEADSLDGYGASDFVRSIDSVTPADGNIDLVAGSKITITPDDGNNRITIATTAMGDGHSLDAADGSPTNVVYVDNTGEVGIGTTLPKSKMDIRGTLNVGRDGTGHDVNFHGNDSGSRMFWNESKMAFRAGIDADHGYWSDVNSGLYSTAFGENVRAVGRASFAVGDSADASGDRSVAMGVSTTASGSHSTAMGSLVSISGSGSFIIGDNSASTTLSKIGANRFYARFANGYFLYTNSTATIGAYLGTSANSWASISDSTKKENFKPIDGEAVLDKISQFKLGTWNYIGQDPQQYRHYGPMAQDFFAAFGHDGIGTIGNDTTLSSADFDGINFIAIQALEKRASQLKKENEHLRSEISKLKNLVTTLSEDWQKLQAQIAVSENPGGSS